MKTVYEQAVRDNQVDRLAPHLHADFHGVMVTGRAVDGMADLQAYWRDIRELIGAGGSYTTTLKPERSVFIGDVALARGSTDDVVVTGEGKEFRFDTMWSAVLVREGGAWKVRAMQGTMDPVTNPFVQEFSRRALMPVGIGAGVAGLLVGLGAGWFLGRRRRA